MNSSPPYEKIFQYCLRCCLPETVEEIKFDERGICNGCNSAEQKMKINWEERRLIFEKILNNHKINQIDKQWDCILPISGGKDSFWQAHVLTKVYDMRPLAVTFSHNWYTEIGKKNLDLLLETFDVDHIMFTPRRGSVNQIAKKSISTIGDSCWHCHAGIGSFPLQIAYKFNIKLIVYGESAAEDGCRKDYNSSILENMYDQDYFEKISAKKPSSDMATNDLPLRNFDIYKTLSKKEFQDSKIEGLHLGDYFFWDEEQQVDFIKDVYGWKEDDVEGTYKRYKSVECKMTGVHDWAKYIKRGFGRATDHATRDVRSGIITREQGFELIRKHDSSKPQALEYFMEQTGMSEQEILNELKKHRSGNAKKLP